MAKKSWVVLDQSQNLNLGDLELSANDLGIAGARVRKMTLRAGLSQGLEVIEVSTPVLQFVVLPGRGMGIWKAWVGDQQLGWESPVPGPVHPAYVPLMEPSGLGWLSGFDELLCRCGLESNGPPLFNEQGALQQPLHGRIANLPAQRVEIIADPGTGEISVTGTIAETRFLFQQLQLTSTVTTQVILPALHIHDRVTNLASRPAEFELLYHINIGRPLLEAGAQLVAPTLSVVPRDAQAAPGVSDWSVYQQPTSGYAEQVFFHDLQTDDQGETLVVLKNQTSTQGLSLSFNKQQLPYFAQWKQTGDLADGYVTGLEPGVNLPNPRPFEKACGRVRTLGPGGSYDCQLTLTALPTSAEVQAAVQTVTGFAAGEPKLFDAPQPGVSVT